MTMSSDCRESQFVNQYIVNSEKTVVKDIPVQRLIKIVKIYSVYRKDHEKRFVERGYDRQKRLLLWHGTKCTNIVGILTNGFKLPDNDKLVFGKGIYFADRATKSGQYCDQQNNGFLLLCEVSSGVMYETECPKPYTRPPDGYNSIKGVGKYIPEPNDPVIFGDSIEVPMGETVENVHKKTSLSQHYGDYNEYVVFNVNRVLIRFIVHFRWLQ
ncbi:uncharacterized protein LOC128961393 [Oppia nitens]|uniref:uncharacterized protein LOC128961393 n=1 Tax=Oppia nitens TaxID=1686743 RepID=UPI0023D9D974|nr:uncharacterized protein LOC128961393 [Oppia nitens]